MGSVYVPVDVANAGIMPMDASGGGGQTEGGYWIKWTASGYTGIDWFWNDTNNYLREGWAAAVEKGGGYVGDGCTGNHDSTLGSFRSHIDNGHTDDLNEILDGWSDSQKWDFLQSNSEVFFDCTESM